MLRGTVSLLFAAAGFAPVAALADPIEMSDLVALCASGETGLEHLMAEAERAGFVVLPHDAPQEAFGPFFEAHTLENIGGALDIEGGSDFSDNPLPNLVEQLPSRIDIMAGRHLQNLQMLEAGNEALVSGLFFNRAPDGVHFEVVQSHTDQELACLFSGRDLDVSPADGAQNREMPTSSLGGRADIASFTFPEASVFTVSIAPDARADFAAVGFTITDVIHIRPEGP